MIVKSNEIPVLIKGHWAARGLAGIWPVMPYEVGGNKVFDLSGNGNTGTFVADTHFVPGKFGPALDFDGSGDAVNCGTCNDKVFTENGPVTISVWIYPRSIGENNFGRVVDRSASTAGPVIHLAATNRIGFQVDGSTALTRRSNDNHITLDTWQHILLTWDGSTVAANSHLYVNGVEVTYATTTDGVNLVDNSAQNFYIGNNSGGNARCFDGLIDNVMIWNYVFPASERILLYREPFCMFERDPIELWAAATQGGVVIEKVGANYIRQNLWGMNVFAA